jgi:flagellar motor switch protein FliG
MNELLKVSQDGVFRRVAKFLLLIGVDEAAKVLSHLTPVQTEKIIPEIATIKYVAVEDAQQILEEFQALIQKSREGGGVDTARAILEHAFGEEKAEQVLEKAVPYLDGKPFEYLDEVDGARLYSLLCDESLFIQCMVLSRVKPPQAAAALKLMDAEAKKDIVKRLAKLAPVAAEVVRQVDHKLHEKMLTMNTIAVGEQVDGRGVLAEMLKRIPLHESEEILATLSETDPTLAFDLRSRLFTAADVVSVNDEYIQRELFALEDRNIAKLIAGKSEEFREKIFANLSKGRRERILEEESLEAPFRRVDCDAITDLFLAKVRREWGDGRIV